MSGWALLSVFLIGRNGRVTKRRSLHNMVPHTTAASLILEGFRDLWRGAPLGIVSLAREGKNIWRLRTPFYCAAAARVFRTAKTQRCPL